MTPRLCAVCQRPNATLIQLEAGDYVVRYKPALTAIATAGREPVKICVECGNRLVREYEQRQQIAEAN